MEQTGTNAAQLIELVRAYGEPLSKGHMSGILKGSARCSLRKGLILHEITGVALDAIVKWPRVRKFRLLRVSA